MVLLLIFFKTFRELYRDDGNIIKLDCGDRYTTLLNLLKIMEHVFAMGKFYDV